MNFKNKNVLITGASSGIGKSCAIKFANLGANLILIARRSELLEQLSSTLVQKFNSKIHMIVLDVREKSEVDQAISNIPSEFSNIDILINNAGLARGKETIQEGVWEKWEEMIDTNIKGLLAVTRAVIPGMVSRKSGHVINLGSIAGHQEYPGGNVYCATKSSVKSISYALRIDLSDTNVRVSSVDPGAVETEFSIVRFDGDKEKANKVYENFEPLVAEDIAETIVWVASRPNHVNIQDIIIMPTAQASATMVHRGT